MAESITLRVRVASGHTLHPESGHWLDIHVKADGTDSILAIKQKISGGRVPVARILLQFGPVDFVMGNQYYRDPTLDEDKVFMSDFSALQWIKEFPHWNLLARLMPDTPPPPGVAVVKAAAWAEKKEPDQALVDARRKGEVPKLQDLPEPWGPLKYKPAPEELAWYIPKRYPTGSAPGTVTN